MIEELIKEQISYNNLAEIQTIIFENETQLNEVLIKFKDNLFGNVIILAGGSGSGEGFVFNKMVDISGKKFDVDELKTLSLKSRGIVDKIKKEFDIDLNNLNLKNPDDVSILHKAIKDLGLESKLKNTMYQNIMLSHPDRKPNLIFDVTLSDLTKLDNILDECISLGYDSKKIHLVWVVNDFNIALKQNSERSRVVSYEIALSTHSGAPVVMKSIISGSKNISGRLDGKIIFAFNRKGIDNDAESGEEKMNIFNRKSKGFYFKEFDYVLIKDAGKPCPSYNEIDDKIKNKIAEMIPDDVKGIWK